jgi:hypothetical protein
MKLHHFVNPNSCAGKLVYRMLFTDGDEREVPLPQPVCSVFVGDHGRAQRRIWTSSLGCSASTHSRVPWTRKRKCQLTTTPCTTPGCPRARIRTKVLLRHILETPLHGRVGIDFHLGQKPKLGGGTPTTHSSIHHILSVLCISMFRFLFLCCSCSYFCFPKHKKTKNISVVSLVLPL